MTGLCVHCASQDLAPGEFVYGSDATDGGLAVGDSGSLAEDSRPEASFDAAAPRDAASDAGVPLERVNRLIAPWPPNTAITVGQGPGGTFTHQKMSGAFDVFMPGGTRYLSVGRGVVTKVLANCPSGTVNNNPDRRCGQGYGNHVVIEHRVLLTDGSETVRLSRSGRKVYSVYGHLDTVKVRLGDRVEAGTDLGTCGLTGYTTGYHIHFQFQDGPTPLLVDPRQVGYRDVTFDRGLEGAPARMLTLSPN
jgi:murein DD-endopeptidase MepM/ murein hydrolase activator NlpD